MCPPRAPACQACPVAGECEAYRLGLVSAIPVKSPPRPRRPVSAVCARVQRAGRVLLVRHGRGLLAGTWTLPTVERSSGHGQDADGAALALRAVTELTGTAPRALRARRAGEVRHVFTHRDLVAEVYDVEGALASSLAAERDEHGPDVRWASPADLTEMAVSSLLRKLLAAGPSSDGEPATGTRGKATRTVNRRRNAT